MTNLSSPTNSGVHVNAVRHHQPLLAVPDRLQLQSRGIGVFEASDFAESFRGHIGESLESLRFNALLNDYCAPEIQLRHDINNVLDWITDEGQTRLKHLIEAIVQTMETNGPIQTEPINDGSEDNVDEDSSEDSSSEDDASVAPQGGPGATLVEEMKSKSVWTRERWVVRRDVDSHFTVFTSSSHYNTWIDQYYHTIYIITHLILPEETPLNPLSAAISRRGRAEFADFEKSLQNAPNAPLPSNKSAYDHTLTTYCAHQSYPQDQSFVSSGVPSPRHASIRVKS